MWFDNWFDIWRIFLIGGAAYVGLVVILRLTGKRSLAKLNAFDFVVTIALGSVLASVILQKSITLAEGLAALICLMLLQFIVTWISRRSCAFAGLMRSQPRLMLRDGIVLADALDKERITRGEIEAAIRTQGYGRVEDIAAVVLESDGTLSVIKDGPAAKLTALHSVAEGGEQGS